MKLALPPYNFRLIVLTITNYPRRYIRTHLSYCTNTQALSFVYVYVYESTSKQIFDNETQWPDLLATLNSQHILLYVVHGFFVVNILCNVLHSWCSMHSLE